MNNVVDTANVGTEINGGLLIVAIMIVCGALGGWAAYHRELDDDPSKGGARVRFLLTGLVASACVPLFLSLTKSEIVSNIIADDGRFENALVFAGLCLMAGFLSRRFLERLGEKVLAEVQEAKVDAKDAKEAAQQALEVADESTAVETAQAEVLAEAVAQSAYSGTLTEDELKALRAMTRLTFRTATGIAADIGMSRSHISELLDTLDDKGLIELRRSPKTGGPRWRLTSLGIATLRERPKST